MDRMYRTFILLLALILLTPQVTFAAWWNPLTWFNNWTFEEKPEAALEQKLQERRENAQNTPESAAPEQTQDTQEGFDDPVEPIDPSTLPSDASVGQGGGTPVSAPTEGPGPTPAPTPVVTSPLQQGSNPADSIDIDPAPSVENTISVNLLLCEDTCLNGPVTREAGFMTLEWSSENATTCTASGDVSNWIGTKAVNGSEMIYGANEKSGTTVYILTCSNETGEVASDSLTVSFTYEGNRAAETFIQPREGDYLYIGEPYSIEWEHLKITGTYVDINLVTEKSRVVREIARSVRDTGQYTWTPDEGIDPQGYSIVISRATDDYEPTEHRSDTFTIKQRNERNPLLTITRPEKIDGIWGFTRDHTFLIEWETRDIDADDDVYIELVGDKRYRIAEDTENDGAFDYYILEDVDGERIPDGEYSLKVCAETPSDIICDIAASPIMVTDKG